MYANSDGDTKEFLRDISAMANNLGGYLLNGIREDDEVPVEIVGIEQGDPAVERILSSALAGIRRKTWQRLPGIYVEPQFVSKAHA